jgi:hypothetical protein
MSRSRGTIRTVAMILWCACAPRQATETAQPTDDSLSPAARSVERFITDTMRILGAPGGALAPITVIGSRVAASVLSRPVGSCCATSSAGPTSQQPIRAPTARRSGDSAVAANGLTISSQRFRTDRCRWRDAERGAGHSADLTFRRLTTVRRAVREGRWRTEGGEDQRVTGEGLPPPWPVGAAWAGRLPPGASAAPWRGSSRSHGRRTRTTGAGKQVRRTCVSDARHERRRRPRRPSCTPRRPASS